MTVGILINVCPRPEHALPLACPGLGRKRSPHSTFSSGSTAWTTRVIPIAAPNSCARSRNLANLATRAGVEGTGRLRLTPRFSTLPRTKIIECGVRALGVDYGLTHSCYDPTRRAWRAGARDSCVLSRLAAFATTGAHRSGFLREPGMTDRLAQSLGASSGCTSFAQSR